MQIRLEQDARAVVLSLAGEFDLNGVEPFEQALEGLNGKPELVIDLRSISFMDSSALRAILRMQARSRQEGFDLAIVPGSVAVRLFELTGLDQKLPIADPGRSS